MRKDLELYQIPVSPFSPRYPIQRILRLKVEQSHRQSATEMGDVYQSVEEVDGPVGMAGK